MPLSALEHYSYCPRQCALIHVEQTFTENLYTLRGRAVHERVDSAGGTETEGVPVERALPLWSARHGLVGRADLVEFHNGSPCPVEYKHGPRRQQEHDDLQLCGQALCLEEMFGVQVPTGAIYHHSSRRRREVVLTPELRERTLQVVAAVRTLFGRPALPPPANDSRCRHCSLLDSCLPAAVQDRERARDLRQVLFGVREAGGP